ncbi:MAG: hypothetical protein M3077_08145 [Candidatus Dormibacteraeota bacterium]|nr:hypothetical protein [Candidatus Dormibacteraeota bacterium]MDQ6884189.1 hypothetical protein [Candidatus Dormibacteraeota bacterium]
MSKAAAVFGILVFGASGAWAFVAPRGFYDAIATYPPYNQHLIHDLGAFQLGLAAALIAGLLLRDALLAVLAGVTVGALLHLIAHIEDQSLGGRPTDPYTVGAIALVLLGGALLRWRESRRG